jgi:predicted nucleic acid-binding protein
MNADVFIDTNIFLYAISDQTNEQEKAQRARELLLTQRWGWSVQVAGEFFVTATSPKRPFQLSSKLAADFVKTWLEFPTAVVGPSTVLRALEVQQQFQLSYWDATIIAAAHALNIHTLLTEDLSDGQNYNGVIVVNPFRS